MERLTSERLKLEQANTLAAPRMRYGLLARLLFVSMDLLYGRTKTLAKFRVLEIIARMPYQAWENVAYIAITHAHADPDFARRIFDWVRESRTQQDNEQWHLLILEELKNRSGIRERFFHHWFLPQVISFLYYNISWLLYVIRPRWSYLLNAHFEDHAEHEYMNYVAENPALEQVPFDSGFEADYGKFVCLADLFRQIGYDERVHKLESLARLDSARFQ
ncbi:MAG: alternative oxidase [Candidatus Binatia bacterium]